MEVNSLDSRLNNYCIKRYLMTEIVFSRVVGTSKIRHSTAEIFSFFFGVIIEEGYAVSNIYALKVYWYV